MRMFTRMCAIIACGVLGTASIGHAGDGVDHKKKVINIAGYDAVTGKYGNYGSADKIGQEIAIEQINNKGGIQAGPLKGYKLKLNFLDDRGDAREAANVAKKIASGDFLTVTGPSMSSSALAANPVFFRHRIANVITYSNADSITAQGFDTIARLPFTTKTISDAVGKSVSEMGKHKVSVIYENQDYGQQLFKALKNVEGKYKLKTVTSDVVTAGQDVDFKSVLNRAKSENPEALVLFVTYNEGGLIVKQAREMGWTIPIIAVESMTDPKFFELAGNVKDVSFVISADADQSTPQAKYLNAQWKKRNGEPMAPNAAVFGYDAIQVVNKIIENGGSTREKFIKGIKGAKVKGGINSAEYTFDKNGDSEKFRFVTILAEDFRKKMK